jgi:hypothetical protein
MGAYTLNRLFKEIIVHELDEQGATLCGRHKGWYYTTQDNPDYRLVQCPKCAKAKDSVTKLPEPAINDKLEFRNAMKHAGGRPRKYASNAERQYAYRQRHNAAKGGLKNSGRVSEANTA